MTGRSGALDADGVPFLQGASSGGGAELPDGLVVVAGSRLVADPFPSRLAARAGGPDLDRGWSALVVVSGSPAEVVPGYARQAERLGLPVPDVRCALADGDATAEVPTVGCSGVSLGADGRRSLQLDFVWATRSVGRQPMSHLWLTYQDLAEPVEYVPVPTVYGTAPAELPTMAASSLPWGALSRVGQPYEPGTINNPGLVVVSDSRLVAPPGPIRHDESLADVAAVLRVDGDLGDVVRSLQSSGDAGASVSHSQSREGGVEVDRWRWSNGDSYTVTAYQRPRRPMWLLVEHSGRD